MSCSNKQALPKHSKVFRYFDKSLNDTIKFYGYTNLDTALYHAERESKSILLIFSGWACMDTPGKEWRTLSVYSDQNFIQTNFILLWLPVDDNRQLKDSVPVNVFGPDSYVKTIGDLNYSRLLDLTETSTVPTFCFLDKRGKVYGQKIGYTLEKNEVETFIKSGCIK